jgi:glutaredoxin
LRRAALVLVVWMLAVGSNEFFRSDARPLFFTGTDWKRQVTAWRLGEIRELTIWPAPWKLAPGRDSSSSSVVTASSGLASAKTKIEVYTRSGCPHCAEARPFLQQLAAERSDLSIVEHDVARDGDALERLRVLSARAGIATPGVPTFVIGERVMVGFDAATTPARIRAALEETAAPEPPDSLELPLVGLVDVAGLGLPLFTALVGLVDGFNPCATWVLLFLLAMLANLRSRSRMALIAGTFVVVSGAVYFAFMAAWLTFFMVIGISQPVRILIAAVALFIGAVNVKDFFAMGRGSSLGISEAAKPGFYRRVREILHADDLAGAMLGIVTLAFLVNLIELLCTAGLPALYTAILTSQGLPSWQYYAYLALYIAAYMLDDAVLVTIGVATLGRRKLQERGGRWLKLLSGLVILALGALLLVRPGWMGF